MFEKLSELLSLRRKDRTKYWSAAPSPQKAERQFKPLSADWNMELATLPSPTELRGRRCSGGGVIAVGSGKGGVGKTVVSSSLALAMAEGSDKHITAIDVDLGGANLHAGLGIPHPTFALNNFLLDDTPLDRLAAPSDIEGLHYIGGASDIVGLTELSEGDRERFLEDLTAMQGTTAVLDLGAGSSVG